MNTNELHEGGSVSKFAARDRSPIEEGSQSGWERNPLGMVQVGVAIPGGPVGDIWVSEDAIAQEGMAAVRERVRGIYRAAYRRERGQ